VAVICAAAFACDEVMPPAASMALAVAFSSSLALSLRSTAAQRSCTAFSGAPTATELVLIKRRHKEHKPRGARKTRHSIFKNHSLTLQQSGKVAS
jgi:hypothetical protein